MRIRIADKEDAKNIVEIVKRHAQDDYMGYATFDDNYIIKKMKRDVFIIAEEASITGCTRLSMVDIDLAEIRTMCVDQKYRRKGVATGLMNETMKIAKERNIRKLIARTRADNETALNFFKKFGFEKEGYFREHYRKGIDVVQLALFIP